MQYILSEHEPRAALRYFEEISAIPRGSGNEEAISDYLMAFAAQNGLNAYRDQAWNVYITKPASKGYENLPPIVLQGHTDMVCEKNQNVEHDFKKDPIQLVLEGNILRANGTTLGADNGVAVSWMMAILTDDSLIHPPLECVFTACEEVGLIGAHNLEFDRISGRRLLNLDCGPEGTFCCGSAGGQVTDLVLPIHRETMHGIPLTLRLRGLSGGHSGGLIHKYLGNANQLMARILYNVFRSTHCCVAQIDGGDKANAIPRECDAQIVLESTQLQTALDAIKATEKAIAGQLMPQDSAFHIETETAAACDISVITSRSTDLLLRLMTLVPNGPQLRDLTMDNRVVASENFASVHTDEKNVTIVISMRSSNDAYREDMALRLETLAQFAGAAVRHHDDYDSWEIEKHSALRQTLLNCYEKLNGKKGKVVATHGGLECGIFQKRLPGVDLVTMCCNSSGAHSPDERMELDSYARCYELLKAVLRELCNA